MAVLDEIRDCVIRGDATGALDGVQRALGEGLEAQTILTQGLIDAMTEVGRRFEAGEYFIPEMLISARAMKSALEPLRPLLVDSGAKPLGTVAIGTVQGDLHDIGKNLVAMMLEGAGFAINDLGNNASPDKFVQAARDGADILALSALLTTTMPAMKTTSRPSRPRACGATSRSSSAARRSRRPTPTRSARTATARTPAARCAWPRA